MRPEFGQAPAALAGGRGGRLLCAVVVSVLCCPLVGARGASQVPTAAITEGVTPHTPDLCNAGGAWARNG